MVIEQSTNYPWDGDIALNVTKGSGEFAMNLRIPGWVQNSVLPSGLYSYADNANPTYSVKVNGEEVTGDLRNGYLVIDRKWKKGDKVTMHFDMPARIVKAHENVADDRGRIAVERGPLVYCAEWCDNDFNVHNILVPRKPELSMVERPDLLTGMKQLTLPVQTLGYNADGRIFTEEKTLTLIPYYAWAHRGEGDMTVWLPAEISAASANPPVTAPREDNGFFK